MKAFYFLTGIVVVAAIALNFYHPPAVVDLEIVTEKLAFRPAMTQSSSRLLLKAKPVSLLGFRGLEAFSVQVEKAFWPAECGPAMALAGVQEIGPTDLLFTPNPGPDAQLVFLSSKLQISDLTVTGANEIALWPRGQSHHKFNFEISGGQTQLRLEMLSDTIRVQTQEYQLQARHAAQAIAPWHDCLGFRPRADARNAAITGSGSRVLIFYDLLNLDPVNEDLLELPMRVEQVNFYDTQHATNGNATASEVECVLFSVDGKKMPELQGLVHIRQNDLSGFELRKLRALHPGRLNATLRGVTGSFYAGVGKKLENQTPSALSHLEAKIGLLIGVLAQIFILYVTLRERIRAGRYFKGVHYEA
jgi:hypothetical protein